MFVLIIFSFFLLCFYVVSCSSLFYTVLTSFLVYAILKLACSLFLLLLLFYFINLFLSIRLVVLMFPFPSMLKHIIWLYCLWDPFIFGMKGDVIKKLIIFLHNSVQSFLTVTMLKYFFFGLQWNTFNVHHHFSCYIFPSYILIG